MMFQVPEPEEWLEYVKKGDEKPETPVWMKDFADAKRNKRRESKSESARVVLGEKRVSAKERAHSDFISLGKKRR